MNKYWIAIAICWLPLCETALPVYGADISPAYATLSIPAGRKGTFDLELKGELPGERLTVEAVDYSMNRDGQVTIALQDNYRYSARKWCQLKPTSLVLNQNDVVKLTIPYSIPASVPGGEYYMGIQIQNDKGTSIKRGPMRTEINVSAIVLVVLQVPGFAPRVQGEIMEHGMEMKDHIPQFKALFKNAGTVSMITHMGVALRKPDRTVVDMFLLKSSGSQSRDGQAYIMPEGLRDFAGGGNRKLPSGDYLAEISAVFGKTNTRVMKSMNFQVKGSDIEAVSPMADVLPTQRLTVEVSAGAINYATVAFKNQGFNAVEFTLTSQDENVRFLPEKLKIEAGKVGKFRARVSVPAFEDPRRDIPVKLKMTHGEKDERIYTLAVYAPGTTPAEKSITSDTKTPEAKESDIKKSDAENKSEQQKVQEDKVGGGDETNEKEKAESKPESVTSTP